MLVGIWKGLRSLFLPEGNEQLETPKGVRATFELRYGELTVGFLHLEDGMWEFRYSDAFRAQDTVRPLIDFPDVSKVYRQEELWPFFWARIPSLAQPKVQEVIAKEGIDARNEVELLRYFGRRTIADPFLLIAA